MAENYTDTGVEEAPSPELDYHALNAQLNLYDANGHIQFDADRAAARQYFLQHVNQNTVFFHDLEEKIEYLIENQYYEPALFDKVQEKLAQNRLRTASRTGKNYYALNGFTRCPKCGKPFSRNVNHSNGHKYLQYRRSCDCGIPSVRADQLAPFVFHAVKNCLFQPANQPKIIEAVNQKLSLRKLMQSGETNTIQNRINGLEKANANLMAYLEQGRATETILRSVEKNEQELQQLKQQLDALDNPISAVDDATYQEIVQKFTNYMCTERSPEAAALKEAVLRDIQIGKETITVNFQHGVFIDEETKAYFDDNRKERAS